MPSTLTDFRKLFGDRLRDRTATVTGGAGFVGSHLCSALVDCGVPVKVIDDLSTGNLKNLSAIKNKITFINRSILYRRDIEQTLEGSDILFHLAARTSAPESVGAAGLYRETNITGLQNVIDAAAERGVKRIVFAGSSAVYGNYNGPIPISETAPTAPVSPYAETKFEGESLLASSSISGGPDSVILRFFNIYGPRQNPHSRYSAAIPAFIAALLAERRAMIYGDGEQTRDFVHVENIVYAMILAALADQRFNGDFFNIGLGEEISVNQLYRIIGEGLGNSEAPEYVAEREGDVRRSCADISKAQTVLGYAPPIGFKEGLLETIGWYKENSQ